jgi:hypothetical protein
MAEQLHLGWDLDAHEARVMHVLTRHRGRAQAIRARDLAAEAGVAGETARRASPREIQEIVHRLRCEHGFPIASTAARPAGYYLPESAAEVEAFVREQRRKALGTLAAIAAVRRIALPELLGQLALETAG